MAEAPRSRRENLVHDLKASALATEAFFRALSAPDFDQPVYDHGAAWTLRELLADLVSIEPSMQWLYRDLLAGGQGSPRDFDLERFNRNQPARLAASPIDSLLTRYRRQRAQTIDILRSLPDSDLDISGRHAYHKAGSLQDFIAWAGIHESLHLADAAAALGRLPAPLTAPDAPWRRQSNLRLSLARFHPTDGSEAGHRRAMLQLTESLGDPFSRHHFHPGHFTASAFILAPAEALATPDRTTSDLGPPPELLLIHHGKLHRWLQPGGHIDPEDPDIESAARREVAEETGIHDLVLLPPSPFDLDVHQIPALGEEPAHLHLDIRLLFRAPGRHFTAGSDAKAATWRPLPEITPQDSDESVMRAIRKLSN